MKVYYPKLYNMAHLLALYFYCFQRIYCLIIFIHRLSDEKFYRGLHMTQQLSRGRGGLIVERRSRNPGFDPHMGRRVVSFRKAC